MTRPPSEEFWSLLCGFRDVVILVWSICLLFFLVSAGLLVTGATDQGPILAINLAILTPPLVASAVILRKCSDR